MNAIYKIPPFYLKLALVVLALVSIWLLFDGSSPEQHLLEEQNRKWDYAMSDFTLTVIDETGKPTRIIKGERMIHYPDDDSTQIYAPISEFIEPGKDRWQIISDMAETAGKRETIELYGNVIISNIDEPGTELRTEQLTINTVDDTAYTDQAVSIKSAYGETDSIGLHAAMEDKMINLHSRVRGQYNAPPAN